MACCAVCRAAALDALRPLGTLGNGVYGGDAIYIWAKLPEGNLLGHAWHVRCHAGQMLGTGSSRQGVSAPAVATGCRDDKAVVEWMVHTHKVSVIPGSGCGVPGHIRVAFGKPAPAEFKEAAVRLHAAMQELTEKGSDVVKLWQQQKHG